MQMAMVLEFMNNVTMVLECQGHFFLLASCPQKGSTFMITTVGFGALLGSPERIFILGHEKRYGHEWSVTAAFLYFR